MLDELETADEWRERLERACAQSLRRRSERAASRREAAERRRAGAATRQAWRLTRLDARGPYRRVRMPD